MTNNGKPKNKSPILRVEGIELVDKHGRKCALLSAADGTPTLTFYDRRKKIRFWVTLGADGIPDLRFFGPNGKVITALPSALLPPQLGKKMKVHSFGGGNDG